MPSKESQHKRLLTRLTLAYHLAIVVLLLIAGHLPSFDSSASLVVEHDWLTSLLRWDAFHYVHIAHSGYVYEHEYAFFPGTPFILRVGGRLLQFVGITAEDSLAGLLLSGSLASALIAIDTIHTLYDLSVYHFNGPHVALLVALLSLLSSSPVTLRYAPYAEPSFTYLSYKGMLYCAKKRYIHAAVSFALASSFRSNGTVLTGYVIWGMLIEPVLRSPFPYREIFSAQTIRRGAYCSILVALSVLPFLSHQYNGYITFCNDSLSQRRPWCTKGLPLIYSFVQSEYWDVGFLRYWTLQQAPNILLAAPVLALLIHHSISHIRGSFLLTTNAFMKNIRRSSPSVRQGEEGDLARSKTEHADPDPFNNPTLTPHAIHALILSIILLTSAHTQIALRLVSALPFTYWAAARLFFPTPSSEGAEDYQRDAQSRKPWQSSKWWVGWSMTWGAIALVTWSVFLPPA